MWKVAVVVSVVLGSACTKKNPDFCEADTDCIEPGRPFCDVDGEFAESGHSANTCSTIPADCPIDRCGCTPGAGLSCDLDQLTVCNADGKSTSTQTCSLGCSTEPRCLTFEPSNHLGDALAMAASEPDVVLPAGARIDTEMGTVLDSAGHPILVKSLIVTQDGASSIRVLVAHSFLVENVTVIGSFAFAIVAAGSIDIVGKLDASGQNSRKGPGGQDPPALAVGTSAQETTCGVSPLMLPCSVGGGGGGNATSGAFGGTSYPGPGPTGGSLVPGFAPLVGGGSGGALLDVDGVSVLGAGGGGGGGVQLVAASEVAFTVSGFVDLGGGGGQASAGGGAGGTLIIEAPSVRFDGSGTGIAANGGAGGGCGQPGADATPNSAAAPGPHCNGSSGGAGATASIAAQDGELSCAPNQSCIFGGSLGGGGGAAGRVQITTKTGDFGTVGTPLVSAVVSKSSLIAR